MTRPQANVVFPIKNRAAEHRPTFSSFRNRAPQPTESWFRMEATADPKVADVYIMDEIGGWWGVTAADFVKELMQLDAEQINLHLNSPGGDVFDGVAIYNALRMHSATVKVYVEGLAASAASFIAQAGDEVIMLRGSTMMIHDASTIAWGDEALMLETATILSKISNNIADIYAQRAGGTMESWRDIMRAEAWYTPDEAVAAKLADKVDDAENSDAQAKASAAWDLKVFNYAGRSNAPDPIQQMLQITNRANKENPVPKLKNDTDQPTTPEGETAPEAPTTETDPAAADGGAGQEEEVPETATPENPQPAAPSQPTPAPSAPADKGSFFLNGVKSTDPAAVQAHITKLENFFKETKAGNRKAFIHNLATGDSPKIMATQIEAMEKLVATMSDEQYGMWEASWEAAPSVSLFAQHGPTDGGSPNGGKQSNEADRIDYLKDVVQMHKDGGMKAEQIRNTDSYKELVKLQPEYTL